MRALTRAGALLALGLAGALASAQNISVTVDGKNVNFPDSGPRYVSGRVLVPVRGVFEEMGAMVDWNSATREVTATSGDKIVKLVIDSRNAIVDGQTRTLDVPPMIMSGRTMVPLRFISEALGADVRWIDSSRQVVITTVQATNTGSTTTTNPMRREPIMLGRGTVVPIALDNVISSNDSRVGDPVEGTVRTGSASDYAGLPVGTKVEGHVVMAKAKSGGDPGLLEVEFDRFRLPDGTIVNIDGSPVDLKDKNIEKNENGILTAKTDRKDDKLVWAGYGAGAGLLVGLLTKKPLEGALLGGLAGLLIGMTNADKKNPRDVTLNPGTEFGVILREDAYIR